MLSAPSPYPVAAPPASENVYHALAGWADRADRRILAAWAVAGWLDALGVAVFLPALWLVALPFLSVSCIGVWGLASRRTRALALAQSAPRLTLRALSFVEAAAVAIGTLAALAAFYWAFLLLLGRRWGVPGG